MSELLSHTWTNSENLKAIGRHDFQTWDRSELLQLNYTKFNLWLHLGKTFQKYILRAKFYENFTSK